MSAIAELLKKAETKDPKEKLDSRISEVDGKIHKIQKEINSLLGFEEHSMKEMEKTLAGLGVEKKRLRAAKFDLPYLGLEILDLRERDGYPTLALASLDSPTVSFEILHRSFWEDARKATPHYSKVILDHYQDVFEMLARRMVGVSDIKLTTEIGGIIPATTKEKIRAARAQFKEIYIAAEAPRWVIQERRPPPQPVDPLVLGFDGTGFWVIDHFDLTPVEKHIKEEFAV